MINSYVIVNKDLAEDLQSEALGNSVVNVKRLNATIPNNMSADRSSYALIQNNKSASSLHVPSQDYEAISQFNKADHTVVMKEAGNLLCSQFGSSPQRDKELKAGQLL